MTTVWLVLQRRVDRRYAIYIDQPLRWLIHHITWFPAAVTKVDATQSREQRCQ